MPAGLRVVLSDRVEHLWAVLADRVRRRGSPFDRMIVAVPSRVVERRAELAVARALGIAAAIELVRLPAELERRVKAATGREVLSAAAMEARVRDVLLTPSRLGSPALAPVERYVVGEGASRTLRERRACELAARLARAYAGYAHDRPEMVLSWLSTQPIDDAGALVAWQAALHREALRGSALVSMVEGLAALRAPDAPDEPPLVVLGHSYLSRLEHGLLRASATRNDVLLLTFTPCAEFWEDATRRSDAEQESRLLASWGTAAREHVAMLDAATDYTSERLFAESDERTRLGRLQASIRERRAPTVTEGEPGDRSLVLVMAPSLRREVEAVAGEIWARVHRAASEAASGEAPLRFPDIAVWVPSRDRELYLPLVETVFAEARDIPWSGVDLALASRSRVVDAIARLIRLIETGPTRAGLLDVLLHPLVMARLPGEPRPEAIAGAINRMGVFFGAGRSELPAAYAADPRAVDLEQAIERLALGEAMLGERSGDARFFEQTSEGRTERWLPEEADLDEGAAGLVLLLRSLLSDVRHARAASTTAASWARFFVALAETYVLADGVELAEHRRALFALRSLGGGEAAAEALSPELASDAACALALRALDALPAAHGASDRGVLVGALAPHRGSDHRLVFVLGLGEGRFPMREADTGLDLRGGERRAGEVTAEDRDRLALLEAVVSARDALVLSWVARDEQTGDAIAPSHAVNELRAVMPDVPIDRPPLRRDIALLEAARGEDVGRQLATLGFPIAEAEARARVLGDHERARWAESPRPLAELARDLPEDDRRRVLLGMAAIPPRAPAAATGAVRVSLAELRAFLDCPVQAAGKRIVGQLDDDDASTLEAEPFDLDPRTRRALVQALVLAATAGAPEAIDALAARRIAHGTFPLGPFGARARALAEDDARSAMVELRRARPAARAISPVRFGAGREHGQDASRVHDPITLGTLPDGRALELVGTTSALLAGNALDPDELLRFDLGARRAGEPARVGELRQALHAFVDHAALALAPDAPRQARPRRGLVLGRAHSVEIALAPLRPDVARRWLASLAEELVTRPQTRFFPVEAVMRVAHLFTGGSTSLERDLGRSIETVRGPKWEGGRSRFGPVREAVRLPAPDAPARLAGQRYAAFFAHLRSPQPTPPTRGAP